MGFLLSKLQRIIIKVPKIPNIAEKFSIADKGSKDVTLDMKYLIQLIPRQFSPV